MGQSLAYEYGAVSSGTGTEIEGLSGCAADFPDGKRAHGAGTYDPGDGFPGGRRGDHDAVYIYLHDTCNRAESFETGVL